MQTDADGLVLDALVAQKVTPHLAKKRISRLIFIIQPKSVYCLTMVLSAAVIAKGNGGSCRDSILWCAVLYTKVTPTDLKPSKDRRRFWPGIVFVIPRSTIKK